MSELKSKLSADAEEFFLPTSGSSSSAKTSDPSVQHVISPSSDKDVEGEAARFFPPPPPPPPSHLVHTSSPQSFEIHRQWHRSPRGVANDNGRNRGRSAFRSQKNKKNDDAAITEAETQAETLRMAAAVALASLLAHANSTLPFGVPPLLPPTLSSTPSSGLPSSDDDDDIGKAAASIGVADQTADIMAMLSAATVAISVESSLRQQKEQQKTYKIKKQNSVAATATSTTVPSFSSARHFETAARNKQQPQRNGKPMREISSTPLNPPPLITMPSSADELTRLIEDAPTPVFLHAVLAKVKTQTLVTSIATSVCIAVKRLSDSSLSSIDGLENTPLTSYSGGSLSRIFSNSAKNWTDEEYTNVSPISLSAYVSSGCTDDLLANKLLRTLIATLSSFSAIIAVSVLNDIASLVVVDQSKNKSNALMSPIYKIRQGLIGVAVDALVLRVSDLVVSSPSTSSSSSSSTSTSTALLLKLKQTCLRSLIALRIQALPLVLELIKLENFDISNYDDNPSSTASAISFTLSSLVKYRISDSKLVIEYAKAASAVSHVMNVSEMTLSVYSLSGLLTMTACADVQVALTSSLSHILQRLDSATATKEVLTVESANHLLIASEFAKISSPPFHTLFSQSLLSLCSLVFTAPLNSKKKLQMISVTAREVAAAVVRIGSMPRMSDPILSGALTVDVSIIEPTASTFICIKDSDCFYSETFVKNEISNTSSTSCTSGVYIETGDSFLSDLVFKGISSPGNSTLPTSTKTHSIPFFVWESLGGTQAAHDNFVSTLLL
jgi:hypothetical protein